MPPPTFGIFLVSMIGLEPGHKSFCLSIRYNKDDVLGEMRTPYQKKRA